MGGHIDFFPCSRSCLEEDFTMFAGNHEKFEMVKYFHIHVNEG